MKTDSTIRRPNPGTTKICSVTTAPLMSAPICRPRIVTTGIKLLRMRVAEDDGSAGQPLAVGGPDVVRAHDLDHAVAGLAHQDGGERGAEHEARA